MFCAGRPSLFGGMPLFEMNPSFGRSGNGPWGSQQMREVIHEVLRNGVRFQDLVGRSQPNCLDHSGRHHCRTHCRGHSSPEDFLEQFIIEDTIRDAHLNSNKDNEQNKCKSEDSKSKDSKTNEFRDKEKHTNNNVEVLSQSLANNKIPNQSTPWSISVDMNGCEEVRARTEDNKIVVEGHTRNAEGFMTVKRVMTLPSHVKGETLTASLGTNGTLILSEVQTIKEKEVNDIPVTTENTHQIIHTDQSQNDYAQDNTVEKETSHVNENESDKTKKLNDDDNIHKKQ